MLRLRPFEIWRLALLLVSQVFFTAAPSPSLLGACFFGLSSNFPSNLLDTPSRLLCRDDLLILALEASPVLDRDVWLDPPASIILLWRAFGGRTRWARLVLEEDVALVVVGGILHSTCTLIALRISFVEWRSTPASKE